MYEQKMELEQTLQNEPASGDPEVVRRALELVRLNGKASPSYFQRQLGIGYNRAAELTDLLEERGVVGPASGSGNQREILIGVNPEVPDSAKGRQNE